MGLAIYYKEDDQFVEMSSDQDLSTPLTTVHDGKPGDTITVCLYLRNADVSKWFSNLRIKPIDLVDASPYGDVAYDETGWGVKLNAGGEEPTAGEWEDIDWGNEIDMESVGSDSGADTTTYFPFWYLITCPPNTDAKVKTDIVLNVSYTENAVVP
jgi:hypothetical protein